MKLSRLCGVAVLQWALVAFMAGEQRGAHPPSGPPVAANAAPPMGASTSQHAVLVELFTSEGCSDCPPADLVLQKLNGYQTATGTRMIGLSEHVTYWNRLGWRDPFSDEIYTQRQEAYSANLRVPEPYTPMAVVMGGAAMNGADGNKILRTADALKSTAVTLHIDSITADGNKLRVVFSALGDLPRTSFDILAFVTDDSDVSEVTRGENGGRTLTHVSVARGLTRMTTVMEAGPHTGEVDLPRSKGPHHLVLVAQEPGGGKVLAAETKSLE